MQCPNTSNIYTGQDHQQLCAFTPPISQHITQDICKFLTLTFWQFLIPHLSPAPHQKRGNPSFQVDKSEAFSERWVSSNMFDLLKYLQKDSQM